MSDQRWQFSLKWLLALTTLASICLAVGVHFAGFMVVVVAVGVIQVAMMLCADWLIRPQNRRALAFATTGAWMMAGSGALVVCVSVAFNALNDLVSLNGYLNGKAAPDGLVSPWVVVAILATVAALCYATAAGRWRKLSAVTSHEQLPGRLIKKLGD